MPKVGNRFITAPESKSRIEVILYYVSEKHNNHFVVTAVDPNFLTGKSDIFVFCSIAKGKTVRGVKGNSEEEALQNFKTYIGEWEKQMITKIPTLLIKVPDAEGHSHFYRPDKSFRDNHRQTGSKIIFEYHYGYTIEVNNKIEFFKLKEYYHFDSDSNFYFKDGNYTMIPGTAENLAKCEAIVSQLNNITDRLQELFKDSETAQKTLQSSLNLLGNG